MTMHHLLSRKLLIIHCLFCSCLLATACLTTGKKGARQPPDWFSAWSGINAGVTTPFTLTNVNQLPIPEGNSSFHQQGIQRLENGGWAVSGSDQDNGYLYFTEPDGRIHTKFTFPDDLNLRGAAAQTKYNHPGGFQIAGKVLAIGIENTDLRQASYSRVVLLDVSDPRKPVHFSHLDIVREAVEGAVMSAGAVGITELADRYLIAVGNWDSKRFDFYTTSSRDLGNPETTTSARLGSWTPGPTGDSYQNFNLYGHAPDALFAIGLYSVDRIRDRADAFLLDTRDWEEIRSRQEQSREFTGGTEAPRFVHAGGTSWDAERSRFQVFSVEAHGHGGKITGNWWR